MESRYPDRKQRKSFTIKVFRCSCLNHPGQKRDTYVKLQLETFYTFGFQTLSVKKNAYKFQKSEQLAQGNKIIYSSKTLHW